MSRVALYETYQDTQRLIYHCVQQHWRKYHGDLEDLIGEANLLFMKAYVSYQRKKGTFQNWLVFTIEKGLMDRVRLAANRNRLCPRDYGDLERFEDRRHWRIDDFLDELSEDALDMITLVFHGLNDGLEPSRAYANAKQALGWTQRQIARVHIEIQRALE